MIILGGIIYVKKLKSSLLLVCLLSLITGCVNQNQQVQNTKEISVVATSIAVTEILDQLGVSKNQVIGIPQSDSYTVPKNIKKQQKWVMPCHLIWKRFLI